MTIYFNGKAVSSVRKGSTTYVRAYVKSTLVFGTAPPPPVTPIALFYGGSSGSTINNVVVRLNAEGIMFGSTTSVGTARYLLQGGAPSSNALFTGGTLYQGSSSSATSLTTLISPAGALVQTESYTGQGVLYGAGCAFASILMVYGGGLSTDVNNLTQNIQRLSSTGANVGNSSNIGTSRRGLAGASTSSIALFFGGEAPSFGTSSFCTKLSPTGSRIGSEQTIESSEVTGVAGTTIGNYATFHGGLGVGAITTNRLLRCTISSNVVSSIATYVGSAKRLSAGGTVAGSTGIFYGNTSVQSTAIRVNSSGSIIGSETTISTIKQNHAGASNLSA